MPTGGVEYENNIVNNIKIHQDAGVVFVVL
jgi:hypothetical protein